MKFRFIIFKFNSRINGGNEHFRTKRRFHGLEVPFVVSACHVMCCDPELKLNGFSECIIYESNKTSDSNGNRIFFQEGGCNTGKANECMVTWIDGWMDGWTDERINNNQTKSNQSFTRERSISRGNEKCPTDSSFSHRNSFYSFCHVPLLKCYA